MQRHDPPAAKTAVCERKAIESVSEINNLFLESLGPESRSWLLSRSTNMALPVRTVLYAAERKPNYAYFITSGMASVVTSMTNGGTAEVGIVGHEGVVGSYHLLGPARVPTECFIQIEATGLRIRYADLQLAFRTFDDVRERMLELVQEQFLSLSQLAGCNRLHGAEERLARWLLALQDRVQSEDLRLTQEFLAQMLGSKRTTVTVVAATMQQAGLISYSRGRVRILDRPTLESVACECYAVIRTNYRNLYSQDLPEYDREDSRSLNGTRD
jgi:CRP-like cAMP-binding protein